MSFEDLGLSENLLKAIADCGYTEPTPIQAQAIPHILMARDVVGLAQTGTGKTASFTLPMIEILAGGRAKARMPRSLILTPTRELAAQIAENFDTYGKYTSLSKALLVGGVSMADQIKKLDRGVDVLIATPGRLLDLFERGQILLNDIKVLVIDEADRMLDMGFIPDIEKIASLLPPIRQTLLFSATMAGPIKKLTEQFLSNPREVSVERQATTAKNVAQNLIWVDNVRAKENALLGILKDARDSDALNAAFVFCNRKRDIDGVCKFLNAKGFDAKALHGDMDQKSRTKTLEMIKDQRVQVLVCSDVAGRGIDVDHITHVFNYDVPMNADDYVHRIGRTGRAGRMGAAYSFAVRGRDEKFVDAVEATIKQAVPLFEVKGGAQAKASSGAAGAAKPAKPKSSKTSDSQSSKAPSSSKSSKPKASDKAMPAKKAQPKSEQKSKKSGTDSPPNGFGDDIPAFLK